MESSTQKSGGVLDLKSLCESRLSKVGGNKRKVSGECGQEDVMKKNKKKKIRNEVPSSPYESDAKKSRNKDDGNGIKSELGFKEKSDGRSKGLHGISLALGDKGSSFNIPKRRRGSVGRKKLESDQGSEPLRLSNSFDRVGSFKSEILKSDDKGGASDQLVRPVTLSHGISNSRSAGQSVGSDTKSKQKVDSKFTMNSSSSNVKLKQKVGADEVKGEKDSDSDSVRNVVKESNLVLNNGDSSAKKWWSHSRKKKDLVVGRDRVEASIRISEPAVDSSVSNSFFTDTLDDEDDDEENLEQNAARMLSSRFDPSCTGFSWRRKSSVSQTTDELSSLSSSARVSINRRAKSLYGGESASGDDNSRTLRPRKGDKGKVVLKPRRHFYEVFGGDLDPYWVLKRRIKIFWPLDDSWYEGIVNDYRSKTKLHHIKYDDRDEEWVNLEEEKFKLLLLCSEVPRKAKSRKPSTGDKDSRIGKTVPPANDDIWNSLDSEPIAFWLASQSQHVKSLPRSPKRRKTSQNHLSLVSSLTSEETDFSNDDADDSKMTRNKPGCESASANSLHVGYVRKKMKSQKKNAGSISVSIDATACGSASQPVTPLAPVAVCLPTTKGDRLYYGCEDSDKQLWSFDDKCKSNSNVALLESKEFRLQICLPLLPYLEFLCGIVFFWMLHDIFMLQHGVIMTTSTSFFLEMLIIDNNLGLRFLMYEGYLKQALAIVFQILIVFSQSDEHWNDDKKLPVASIRFQLSSVHDLRKQQIFAVYCFSKLQSSKWLYLEPKILQQCLLIKQLSFSECTYGNIKKLECGISQPCKPPVGLELSSSEFRHYQDVKKKFEEGILPRGVSVEACSARTSQSAFSQAAEPGKVSQLPIFFFNFHLQSLMEHSYARANLQHQDAICSQETLEKGGQPVAECAQFELSSVTVQDFTTEHKIRQSDSEAPAFKGLPSYQRIDSSVFKFNSMGSKISSKHGRSSTNSPVWSDGKPNFMPNGFSNGSKKPRTQVQYTLPFAGYGFSKKQEMPSSGSLPYKRIRRASLIRISDGSGNDQKNLDLLTCVANVLVTNEDRGWRECGAHIVSEVADDNEWRLAVKLSGVTKFSYKVKHILQPGSTNRYSHAMIWKGGKDWVLEFPERSQWMLFKEMYEECYNRNIRAACVKNIPIPGVCMVDENEDYGDGVPFVRNSTMYFRQVQNDAEMALDPLRILYDMDSDDEQWLMSHKKSADKHKYEVISEEFFEMRMDMFEKVSYAQHRDKFTDAEGEELAIGIGSVEAVKLVYQHWRQKREKLRMPLIRHFQPPPWERYQRQLKEWEQNVARGNCAVSFGGQEKEKPPMFAFCLKPRGLDVVPNKVSKQRSHRKFTVSGNHRTFSGDRDSPLVYGRRPFGHAFADEKLLYTNSIHEFSDVAPSCHPSARVCSPRDSHFSMSTEWKVNHKVYKNKHKKRLLSYPYFHRQRSMSYNQRTTENKNGVQSWNLKQLNISDLDEFHLRDALGAARHARKMSKFLREKAQSLLYKADLAIHKAVSTLMNAEAMKKSSENSIGEN